MGAHSRRKGAEGEREIVNLAKTFGLAAVRTWQCADSLFSGVRARDVQIGNAWYQVKRRQGGFGTLYRNLEHVAGLFLRDDNHEWIVVLRGEDFLKMLGTARTGQTTGGNQ